MFLCGVLSGCGEICALGADAIALAPEELVDDVVARLRAVAGRWAR